MTIAAESKVKKTATFSPSQALNILLQSQSRHPKLWAKVFQTIETINAIDGLETPCELYPDMGLPIIFPRIRLGVLDTYRADIGVDGKILPTVNTVDDDHNSAGIYWMESDDPLGALIRLAQATATEGRTLTADEIVDVIK